MLRAILLCGLSLFGALGPVMGQSVKVGEAEYFLAPKGGENRPPDAPNRTPELM